MLVLFETAAGFGIFKVLDEQKLEEANNLEKLFESQKQINKTLRLQEFKKFADSAEALQAGVAVNEGKLCKPLKKLLKKVYTDDVKDKLMVWDPKLGSSIKEKLNINVTSSGPVGELMRCIKFQIEPLIPGLEAKELSAMSLGLAHNLSRYKLKFSPDKVDTMIIQAINLLDDLDKELNNYIMRAREWYGWHFPELGKIIPDHMEYVKTVLAIGTRDNVSNTDLSEILHEDVAARVQEAAEVSMGTEIIEEDVINIQFLCREVQDLSAYRAELNEYLLNRMTTISPNLTVIVGELVGARLMSHAGSLMSLAKLPASTIQLLGAEKALFSALKARKSTPKYGTIYHAAMVSSASAKLKGKMARMLAAKAALAARCDALAEVSVIDFSIENKARLSTRIQMLESGFTGHVSHRASGQNTFETYKRQSFGDTNNYNNNTNENLGYKRRGSYLQEADERPAKKIKIEDDYEGSEEAPMTTPKHHKQKKEKTQDEMSSDTESSGKKKKIKDEIEEDLAIDAGSSGKKIKKKKVKDEDEAVPLDTESSGKKKKKLKLEEEVEEIPVIESSGKKKKKPKLEEDIEEIPVTESSGKKKKKQKLEEDIEEIPVTESSGKKKKKRAEEEVIEIQSPVTPSKKKKKRTEEDIQNSPVVESSEKKKKKKKKDKE